MSQQRSPRGRVSQDLIKKLIAIGVPDDPAAMRQALNDLAVMSIDTGTAYLPDLSDSIAVETALGDRIEELTKVNLELLRTLVELGGASEHESLLRSMRELLKEIES